MLLQNLRIKYLNWCLQKLVKKIKYKLNTRSLKQHEKS